MRSFMHKLQPIDWVAFLLVIVGALNWGLVGIFNFNLVDTLFGVDSVVTNVVYGLVALAGVFLAFTLPYYARTTTTPVE